MTSAYYDTGKYDESYYNTIDKSINSNGYIASGVTTYTVTIDSDDYVLRTYPKTKDANSYLKQTYSQTLNSDNYTLKSGNDKTITGDDWISKTVSSTKTSDAQLTRISQTTLVYPANGGKDTSPVIFRWQIPSDLDNKNMNCELIVGSTTYKTWVDSGFEYYTGIEWVEYPSGGVSSGAYGQEARKSVTIGTTGDITWKVRGACETV